MLLKSQLFFLWVVQGNNSSVETTYPQKQLPQKRLIQVQVNKMDCIIMNVAVPGTIN
jgi:hypothetical protein